MKEGAISGMAYKYLVISWSRQQGGKTIENKYPRGRATY